VGADAAKHNWLSVRGHDTIAAMASASSAADRGRGSLGMRHTHRIPIPAGLCQRCI